MLINKRIQIQGSIHPEPNDLRFFFVAGVGTCETPPPPPPTPAADENFFCRGYLYSPTMRDDLHEGKARTKTTLSSSLNRCCRTSVTGFRLSSSQLSPWFHSVSCQEVGNESISTASRGRPEGDLVWVLAENRSDLGNLGSAQLSKQPIMSSRQGERA